MRAYPRVRGGTTFGHGGRRCCLGLSPRPRGNHRVNDLSACRKGPIPASAGEPRRPQDRGPNSGAYPRVRGGTTLKFCTRPLAPGLSPRPRGNHSHRENPRSPLGPIPASAGEPDMAGDPQHEGRAYPRVRGGTVVPYLQDADAEGLSPRPRGNPVTALTLLHKTRPIPASAGEPLEVKPMTPKVKHTIPSFRIVKERRLTVEREPPTCRPSRPVPSAARRGGRARRRQFCCFHARP